jgi:hypothetical protein
MDHNLDTDPETPSEDHNEPNDLESRLDRSINNIEHSSRISTDVEKESSQNVQTGNNEAISRIPTAQDWNGPNDPENPQNWPLGKKAYHTVAVGFLAFA